jgi:hypothetical protein
MGNPNVVLDLQGGIWGSCWRLYGAKGFSGADLLIFVLDLFWDFVENWQIFVKGAFPGWDTSEIDDWMWWKQIEGDLVIWSVFLLLKSDSDIFRFSSSIITIKVSEPRDNLEHCSHSLAHKCCNFFYSEFLKVFIWFWF